MLASPQTMAITTDLAGASSISIDVYTPGGSFGYYQQWDLALNNTDIGGYVSVDSYAYSESPSIGNETTLTWTLPASITSVLATSANPTSINFQIGGGYSAGNETMYLDNVQAILAPPATFQTETTNWVTNGSSAWETATNWGSNPNIPGGAGSQITFDNNGGAITANPTVTLSNPAAATLITFGNANGSPIVNYTINAGTSGTGGSLAVATEIDADSGSHAINVPVSTSGSTFYFGMAAGASLTIPNFSDSSYGSINVLSPLSGQTVGGTLTFGASLHLSLNDNGATVTFIDGSSGGFLYGITALTGSTVNLGKNVWNTNSLGGDSTSFINVPVGGTLYTAEYLGGTAPSNMAYSGNFSGGGSIVIGEGDTSTDTSQVIYGNIAQFYGNNSGFFGTMTAGSSFPAGTTYMTAPAQFVLQVDAADELGDGSATNMVILDGGILQARASFTGTQNVVVTANGGTIDTAGNNVGLGTVSSTTSGSFNKINGGTLTVSNIRGVGLTIGNVQNSTPTSGGEVQIASNGSASGVSVLNSLTFQQDGSGNNLGLLDLTNNSMIVHNGSASAITSEIAVGYNGGHWNGAVGITSSTAAGTTNTALGVELNSNGSAALLSTFEGQPVTSTDVLVKYTYFGDANLDGVVNGSDYTLIDNGFNNNLTGWHNGDFNYDGVVNGDDYTLIDNAFNTQGAQITGIAAEQIASPSASVAVPEPASLGLLGIGSLALAMRRRRSR